MKTFTLLIFLLFTALSAQSQFYFTANPSNPALEPTGQEAWDDGGVFTPHIQYSNGTYYLFYAGWSGQFGNPMSIGLASSEDGFNFSKVTTNSPLLFPDGTGFDAIAVADPVILYKDEWVLYYAGVESASYFLPKAIGRATSASVGGPYIHDENPVLETGGAGEWDSYFIHPSSVIYTNGQYLMFYWAGDMYPGGEYYIGLATSTDGITWTKYDDPSTTESPFAESDPVLKTGEPGDWDESSLLGCSVHQTDNGLEMFYGGFSQFIGGAIGYATSTDGIFWTKDESQNPLFEWTDDPYAVSNNNWVIEIPSLVYYESVAYLYYDYGPGLGEIGMAVSPVAQDIIYVPDQQPTIQQGIDAASDGDLVLVDEGTYYENIKFEGKAITVSSRYLLDGDSSHISNTIIDGSQPADPDSASCVMFVNGEDTTSVIRGFTITGGSGVYERVNGVRSGGGVFAYNSGSKILNNLIKENEVEGDSAGGAGIGIFMDEGAHWAVIRHNNIKYNSSSSYGLTAFGGGISTLSNAIISNNIIEFNDCTNTSDHTDGAGIEVEEWLVTDLYCEINNNIIRYNTLDASKVAWGAGISVHFLHNIQIEGNIISNNISDGINGSSGGGISVRSTGYISITENNITSNLCTSNLSSYVGGAGINLFKPGETWIENNEIAENTINAKMGTNHWGAGIMVDKPTEAVYVTHNQIKNNYLGNAYGGNGGGISFYITDTVPVYFTSNIVSDNYSDYRGGGLCGRNIFHAYMQNNLFKNNSCYRYGGAIMLFESTKKEIASETYHPVIANNTFVGNDAEFGGAVYSRLDDEVPVIFNSLFCNNAAEYSPDIYHIGGNGPAVYNNLIDTAAIFTQWTGNNNICCDAGLIDDSLHLDYSSQCLNAGTALLSFDGNFYPCPDKDIDGEPRPYEDTNPDIGADEAQWYYVQVGDKVLQKPGIAAYPNPFAAQFELAFALENESFVSLQIIDLTGQVINTILNETKTPGAYQFNFDGSDLPAGVYFCVLKTKKDTQTIKMVKF